MGKIMLTKTEFEAIRAQNPDVEIVEIIPSSATNRKSHAEMPTEAVTGVLQDSPKEAEIAIAGAARAADGSDITTRPALAGETAQDAPKSPPNPDAGRDLDMPKNLQSRILPADEVAAVFPEVEAGTALVPVMQDAPPQMGTAPCPFAGIDMPRLVELAGKVMACERAMQWHEVEATRLMCEQGGYFAEMRNIVGHGRWLRWIASDSNPTGFKRRAISERIAFWEFIELQRKTGQPNVNLLGMSPVRALEAAGLRRPEKEKNPKTKALKEPEPSPPPSTSQDRVEDKELASAIRSAPTPDIKVNGLDVAKPILTCMLPRVVKDDQKWGHRDEATVLRQVEGWIRQHPDGFTVVFERNPNRVEPRCDGTGSGQPGQTSGSDK